MKFYPKNTSVKNRIHEIDFIRGIAIVLMVIYHWFSLLDLKKGSTYTRNPILSIFGHLARTSFIILVGVSSQLSKQNSKNNDKYIRKQLERVLYLIIYALLITIISKLAYPNLFIRFGILHYMAVTLFLLTFLNLIPEYVGVIIGLLMLSTYIIFMKDTRTSNLFLNALGFRPNYNTMDYFPIFRWFWLSAIGLFIGKNIYKNGKRKYSNPGFDKNGFSNFLVFLGKYSLEIYLLHLPIIYLIQYIIYK